MSFFEANNVVNLYIVSTMKHTIETYHGQCVKAPSGIRKKYQWNEDEIIIDYSFQKNKLTIKYALISIIQYMIT